MFCGKALNPAKPIQSIESIRRDISYKRCGVGVCVWVFQAYVWSWGGGQVCQGLALWPGAMICYLFYCAVFQVCHVWVTPCVCMRPLEITLMWIPGPLPLVPPHYTQVQDHQRSLTPFRLGSRYPCVLHTTTTRQSTCQGLLCTFGVVDGLGTPPHTNTTQISIGCLLPPSKLCSPLFAFAPINHPPRRYPKDVWPGHKPPDHDDGSASSGANGVGGGGGGRGGEVAAGEVLEFFCDGCDDTIPTGTERMECAVCPDEFCLCHSCYDEGEVRITAIPRAFMQLCFV